MNRFYKITLSFLLLIVAIFIDQVANAGQRAIWVTRWNYQTADDVIKIMKNARDLGATDVLFQVRGEATVFYPSKIEPWAWELTGDSPATLGKNPGWDPLGMAINEGKKHGLDVHAWINVFPAWKGKIGPSKSSNHLWVKHRSWFMLDHRGSLLWPTESFYTFLSPGIPEVRSHISSVCAEMVANYPDLKGIHLDYIRYPAHREIGGFRDFSYDKISVKAFKEKYGGTPRYDLPTWQAFKRDQVTATIQAIRQAIDKHSKHAQLSATFVAEINKATSEVGQDPRDWFSQKLVDWAVPMLYKRNVDDFKQTYEELNQFFTTSQIKKMSLGINVHFNSIYTIRKQLEFAFEEECLGEVLFAYTSLFNENHKPNSKASVVKNAWQEQRIQEILLKNSAGDPLSSQ